MCPALTLTARGQGQKRPRKVEPEHEHTPPPEPQWKRAGFRSAQEARTAFWDNLPKAPLCPSALRELDRRNWLSTQPTSKSTPTSTKRIKRSATRAAKVEQLALKDRAPQLERFARRGGPDLRDLMGYCYLTKVSPTMPRTKNPSRTAYSSENLALGRTSAYNAGFEQNLIKHGVYPYGHRHADGQRAPKPDNWGDIQQIMIQPRPSLSPSQFSDSEFDRFVDKTTDAVHKADVIKNVFPILEGESDMPSGSKRLFTNLAPLTDGTIVDDQPDYYHGARPSQLDPRVHKDLNAYIIPSKKNKAPILPNDFTEWKGPDGKRAVVQRQACYDGAIGARAIQHLQSYGQSKPVYDNNAYVITHTFDSEHLHMYTTHPTAPTSLEGLPEYHMNQLNSWGMTGNIETFRQGVTAYRNTRDWAKKKRDEFIKAVNKTAASLPQDTVYESSGNSEPSTSTKRATVAVSNTSADEVTVDNDNLARPRKRQKVEER